MLQISNMDGPDLEVAKALELMREMTGAGDVRDLELLVDVSDKTFVWVSEEMARLHGQTVPQMIGSQVFKAVDMPADELRSIIMELMKDGRYRLPMRTKAGKHKTIELEFKPIYLGKERPFLVARVLGEV